MKFPVVRRPSRRCALLTACLLFALAGGAFAQRSDYLTESFSTKTASYRSNLETGFLYAGAEPQDLDRGILGWDYVTYSALSHQLDDKNRVRLVHQYWDYLTTNYENYYSAEWRHEIRPFRAWRYSFDYTEDHEDFRTGMFYLGREGLIARDLQWIVRGGVGAGSDHEFQAALLPEILKPLSPSTMLRVGDGYIHSTDGYWSNASRIYLIQALSRRLALNLGYRFYLNNDDSGDGGKLRSHEVSSALVYQARENLFLTGEVSRYDNNQDVEANNYGLSARWFATDRVSLLAGYRFQDYQGAPDSNGVRFGISFDF